ncbi:hypothetical protein IMSAGC012_03029 [Lachnospiraceae bacterium]|nr:DUF1682 domain-containing protein [Clostridiaceae bacterium]GFI27900.1 hypothetical protein IMSAGC012_03029 [Lachnospiraceae bacterium]
MSIEITNNYSNYAANYTDTVKKPDSRAAAETKVNTSTNSKDKVQAYYEQLCRKFPQINVNSNRGIAGGGKNNIVLNLSDDCLKKMASDPDFARKIENDIAGIPAAHEQMFAKAKSDGIEIHGFAVRINADGSMQCSCSGSTRISGTKQSTSILNTEKRQKERVEKKREERKILEEKAAERRAERKEQMDKLTEDGEAESFAVSATGMDIKSVTQNLMATVSGTSAPIGAGFDIKA